MGYLHEQGIVHGDLKPENILVTRNVHAVLCDFGLSKFASVATSASVKGGGSWAFMSPETLKGGSKTFASDMWAVGMVIFQVGVLCC